MADLGGFDSSEVIVIDTETTGLNPGSDEVLSLSIIDGDGNVLFDDLVKPAKRKRWPNATKINGIAPSDVKDKQTLAERRAEVMPILSKARLVVGYNVDFDLRMLRSSGLPVGNPRTFDLMKEYAKTEPGGSYIKLEECAKRYGYAYDPHSSLSDVQATLFCFRHFVYGRDLTGNAAKTTETQPGSKSGCLAGSVLMLLSFVAVLAAACAGGAS